MPFTGRPLVVAAVDDRTWELVEPLVYHGRDDVLVIPAGFRTDFATVPRILQWIVPRTGRYSAATVVHDWLIESRTVPRRDADGVFRRVLRELGVPVLLRWLMFAAVRFGARELDWRAVGVGLAALPVLGPPTLLAALALGVYTAAEWVAGLIGGSRGR